MYQHGLDFNTSGDDGVFMFLLTAGMIFFVAIYLYAVYASPAQERKEAERRREDAERAAWLESTRRHVEAAKAKQELEREKERRKAAEKAAKIEANKSHVEDLRQLLEAKLELARATQAKADREKDEYKKIQLVERATRLYVQANEIETKIKKLSE